MSNAFVEQLQQLKWKFTPSTKFGVPIFPEHFKSVPLALTEFVGSHTLLCSENETRWFLSSVNYQNSYQDDFNWNEFELLSTQAATGDQDWEASIKSFWACHLPIFMSVDGYYSYAAYCLSGVNKGNYVYGSEPEFEQVTVIGDKLHELQTWVLNASNT